MIDVISLNFEGKEFQSFAPAYLSCILRLNLKISLDWSRQSKLCNILKILIFKLYFCIVIMYYLFQTILNKIYKHFMNGFLEKSDVLASRVTAYFIVKVAP